MEQLVFWVAWVVLMALLAGAAVVRWQGDCEIHLADREARAVWFGEGGGSLRARFRAEFVNRGRQNGMILDVWVRTEHLGRLMEKVIICPRLASLAGRDRPDGYWEALIVEKGKRCPFEMDLLFYGPSSALAELRRRKEIPLVFHHKTVGRNGLRVQLSELSVLLPITSRFAGSSREKEGIL